MGGRAFILSGWGAAAHPHFIGTAAAEAHVMPTRVTLSNRFMRASLLALAILSFAASRGSAQLFPPLPHPADSVIGTSAGRIWVLDPDRATFHIIVEDSGATQLDAISRARTHVPAVVAQLRRVSRTVTEAPPVMVHVGERPTYNAQDPSQHPIPYIARTMIRVNALPTDSLPRLFEAVAAAGATVSTITFFSTKADSVRKARLPELVAIAQQEAEAIAGALGGRLGALIDIHTTGGVGYEVHTTIALDSRHGGSVSLPQTNVPSSVSVRYRLIRP